VLHMNSCALGRRHQLRGGGGRSRPKAEETKQMAGGPRDPGQHWPIKISVGLCSVLKIWVALGVGRLGRVTYIKLRRNLVGKGAVDRGGFCQVTPNRGSGVCVGEAGRDLNSTHIGQHSYHFVGYLLFY
jgi:hypothetical protein